MKTLADIWRRRYWRRDDAAIQALGARRPAIVITGASEGIGKCFAALCARRAEHLVLIARTAASLDAVAQTLRADHPSLGVTTLAVDVAHSDAIDEIDRHLAHNNLYADVLIANAGIGLSGPFTDNTPDDVDHLVTLNVLATTRLIRHVLPDMRTRGRGGIITMASLGGFAPGPYQAAYYASKAYQIALSRAVAWELRGQGVRLVAVAPGPVETAFHRRMNADHALYRYMLPAIAPERVARSALFAYDYGATLVVPGLLYKIAAVFLSIMPAILSMPVLAVLLRPPNDDNNA